MHTLFRKDKLVSLGLGIALMVGLSACGSNGFVSDAKVSTSTIDGEIYANLEVTMQTGGVVLPSIQMPIWNPNNPMEQYGTFSLSPVFGSSQTVVNASVNLSKTGGVTGTDGRYLPNGHLIPVGGISNTAVLAIPVGGDGLTIYLAFSETNAMLGFAIPIQEFDSVSRYIGGIDIFPGFNFKNGVTGVAGIYTSPAGVNKNGLALFVDFSSLLNQNAGLNQILAFEKENTLKAAGIEIQESKLQFNGVNDSSSKKYKAYKAVDKLARAQRGRAVHLR